MIAAQQAASLKFKGDLTLEVRLQQSLQQCTAAQTCTPPAHHSGVASHAPHCYIRACVHELVRVARCVCVRLWFTCCIRGPTCQAAAAAMPLHLHCGPPAPPAWAAACLICLICCHWGHHHYNDLLCACICACMRVLHVYMCVRSQTPCPPVRLLLQPGHRLPAACYQAGQQSQARNGQLHVKYTATRVATTHCTSC